MFWGALLFSLTFSNAVAQDDVTRVTFDFGFSHVGSHVVDYIPSKDVERVVCQIQSILTTSVQELTGQSSLVVKASEADWKYNLVDQERPVSIAFTVDVDTDRVETYTLMMNAMAEFDLVSFMNNLPGFFEGAMDISWNVKLEAQVEGELKEIQCNEATEELDSATEAAVVAEEPPATSTSYVPPGFNIDRPNPGGDDASSNTTAPEEHSRQTFEAKSAASSFFMRTAALVIVTSGVEVLSAIWS